MNKFVYLLTKTEYTDEGHDKRVLSIHETAEGALSKFREEMFNSKAEYAYEETGSTDIDEQSLKDACIDEQYTEDVSEDKKTIKYCVWHIWRDTGWHELFVELFRIELEK